MDEKVLKGITFLLTGVTIVMCALLYYFPHVHEQLVLAAQSREISQAQVLYGDEQDPEEIVEEADMNNAQLKIELPKGIAFSDITIENNYLTKDILIHIPKDVDDYFAQYSVKGSCDHIAKIAYYKEHEEGVIVLGLDTVYELKTEYDAGNLYLDFLNPHDIYDKIIVVDAGHGGRDPGASRLGIYEKDIDLAIAMELRTIFESSTENIGVYYTRTDDSNPSLQQRAQLANELNADLFISIHNNAVSGRSFSSTKGTQILYSESDEGEFSSLRFAQICLEQVTGALESDNVGVVAGDHIYIVRTSEVPVALIEVGFMSNRKELDNLNSPDYQKKAAQGIYAAIVQAFEEGY